MRAYSYFMLVVSTIILLVLGISCVLFYNQSLPGVITSFLRGSGRWTVGIGGIVFTLLAVGEIYIALKGLGKTPAVAFSNPLGEVRVAYNALEGYIKGLSAEIPEISAITSRVTAGRDGIEIHNQVVVEKDVNIPEVTTRLQDLVSKYVKDVLGIEDVAAIKVYINKISPGKGRKSEEGI